MATPNVFQVNVLDDISSSTSKALRKVFLLGLNPETAYLHSGKSNQNMVYLKLSDLPIEILRLFQRINYGNYFELETILNDYAKSRRISFAEVLSQIIEVMTEE